MSNSNLRAVLSAGEFIVAPGVFEMFSAKIADRMGFKALYMTGYGISASHLGLADAGLVTYRDMVERARTIAQGTATPLIADADTGFGGLLNVRETVRGYEAAGVQAIQIEDQEMPKKCGHTPNRRVVPLEDAVKRIEVAVASRRSSDFLIVARTDARTGLGLEEAIRRASGVREGRRGHPVRRGAGVGGRVRENRRRARGRGEAARQHGADRKIADAAGGDARAARLSIAIYPSAGMGAACAALESAYGWLLKNGSLEGSPVPAFDMKRLHELVGFPDVWEFERRYVEK